MQQQHDFDAIIIGGSYSGLAAGMSLGRALKQVLIIDEGKPCNSQTPFSHNFLTNDGKRPHEIAEAAREQVRRYSTIRFLNRRVSAASRTNAGFSVDAGPGNTFTAGKLIFATGIRDLLVPIEGLAACWGISVIHCPYCHGYEVRGQVTGILLNGEHAYDLARLIYNWTNKLTLFTNGTSTLTPAQAADLDRRQINIVEKQVRKLVHTEGLIERIVFTDESDFILSALYAPAPFQQHCPLPQTLGCEITEDGYIKVDAFQETTVPGVYACGDSTTRMRTVANAVAMGTTAGISVSKQLIAEAF